MPASWSRVLVQDHGRTIKEAEGLGAPLHREHRVGLRGGLRHGPRANEHLDNLANGIDMWLTWEPWGPSSS